MPYLRDNTGARRGLMDALGLEVYRCLICETILLIVVPGVMTPAEVLVELQAKEQIHDNREHPDV